MPNYFHMCLLTFTNCVIRSIIFRFLSLSRGTHICSAIWNTANLECVLCHLTLILSSSSTQVEHYLESYLLLESNWNIGVEGMVVVTVKDFHLFNGYWGIACLAKSTPFQFTTHCSKYLMRCSLKMVF